MRRCAQFGGLKLDIMLVGKFENGDGKALQICQSVMEGWP